MQMNRTAALAMNLTVVKTMNRTAASVKRKQGTWNGVCNHRLEAWDLHETIPEVEDKGSSWTVAAAAVEKDAAVLGCIRVQGLKGRRTTLSYRRRPFTALTSEDFLPRILKLRPKLTRNKLAERARAAVSECRARRAV
jgi:hypothetical protein